MNVLLGINFYQRLVFSALNTWAFVEPFSSISSEKYCLKGLTAKESADNVFPCKPTLLDLWHSINYLSHPSLNCCVLLVTLGALHSCMQITENLLALAFVSRFLTGAPFVYISSFIQISIFGSATPFFILHSLHYVPQK